MLKENISLSQLAALIFNFYIGSAIAIGLGLQAKEDAWIVILISLAIGLILSLFYYYIGSLLPGKNLYQIFEYCFKRPIAIFISMVYIVFFFILLVE